MGEGESRLPIYQPAFQCTQRTTFVYFLFIYRRFLCFFKKVNKMFVVVMEEKVILKNKEKKRNKL
jgi:hypothetical protein